MMKYLNIRLSYTSPKRSQRLASTCHAIFANVKNPLVNPCRPMNSGDSSCNSLYNKDKWLSSPSSMANNIGNKCHLAHTSHKRRHCHQGVLLSISMGVILGLTGCQNTPDDNIGALNRYQTSTQPTDNNIQDKHEVARVRTSLAAQYIRKKELDAATRQLEKAFAADSRYAPAYDMMGVLLQQEGSPINLKKADSYFQKAISLDKELMQARNNYGVYLVQMKRYKEAVQQFEIAGAALGYEGRIGALENLGRTYLQLKNPQAALKAFLRALEGNRNSVIAHIELVDLLIEQNRIPQAQNLYEETLLLIGRDDVGPRVLLQGIKLASVHRNYRQRQKLAEQLLSSYPLSDEAKKLKTWLRNPEAAWK